MKWIRFQHDGSPHFGILQEDSITVTSLSWKEILEGRAADSLGVIQASEAALLAPLDRPGKIVAIGLNYMDHCRETNSKPPEKPIVFCKFPTSVVGPGDEIRWSEDLTRQVDYEAELAVVIGRTARSVSEEDALDYVFGYTVGNDVSARDLQFSDGQWVRAKSIDTFCPLGPAIVTANAVGAPQNLNIRSHLNGQTMQDSNTSEMIFSVVHLISFCSHAFTLEPGDVILTGTPHGVGVGRDPQIFMTDGDHIVVEIEGIGSLENTCRIRESE